MSKYKKTGLSILLSTDTTAPELNALDPISQAEMNLFWNKLQSKIQYNNNMVRNTGGFVLVTFIGLMFLQSLEIIHYFFKVITLFILFVLCIFQVVHVRRKSKLMVEFVNVENKAEWNNRGFNWVLASQHGPGDDDPIKMYLELHACPEEVKAAAAAQKQNDRGESKKDK